MMIGGQSKLGFFGWARFLVSSVVNAAFWRSPPWQGGGAKHRMGLRPVEIREWFEPVSVALERQKADVLNHRYADAVAVTGAAVDAAHCLARLPGPEPASRYPDLIANVACVRAEDLCLLDLDDRQRLVAACVCAPSYWRVQDKIGLPLWDVHGPVHGMNAKIGANVQRFIARMPSMQPFERRNWFLHGDAERFHLEPEGPLTAATADWVVRSERQTLCKLSDRFMLFTIAVICEPLEDIAQFPDACREMQAALAAMDTDEITHFGGVEKHRRLSEYVDRLCAAPDA